MLDRRALLAGAALLAAGTPARGQAAMPGQIRLMVPFPPGGGTDILARLFAGHLGPRLGASFVVENRAGGAGTIGSDLVARAAPDGATLVLGTSSSHAIAASLNAQMPHDVVSGFTPVAMVAVNPFVLVVHPSVAASTVPELVAAAKAAPGRFSYASSGNGTTPHLAAEMFKAMAGVDILHVPYRGSPAAMPDLLAGRVQMMFDSTTTAVPNVRAGSLRALGVTGPARLAALPDVPTIAESGLAGYEAMGWFALFGPAGLPTAYVERLNAAVNEVAVLPEVRAQLEAIGCEPRPMSPQAFAEFQRAEVRRWGEIVRAGGIRAD